MSRHFLQYFLFDLVAEYGTVRYRTVPEGALSQASGRSRLKMRFVAFLFCLAPFLPPSKTSSAVLSTSMQVFGQSKLSTSSTVDILVRIVRRYDLLLIQEVRDKSETAIFTLLDLVNNGTETYNATVSRRLGRTSSKEQYAFLYKMAEFRVVSSFHCHDTNDTFERERFVVLVEGRDNGTYESGDLTSLILKTIYFHFWLQELDHSLLSQPTLLPTTHQLKYQLLLTSTMNLSKN